MTDHTASFATNEVFDVARGQIVRTRAPSLRFRRNFKMTFWAVMLTFVSYMMTYRVIRPTEWSMDFLSDLLVQIFNA